MTAASRIRLVRDGTIFGAGRTEIDFRTPDYNVWLTIKADSDARAEVVASALEAAFGGDEQRPESGAAQDQEFWLVRLHKGMISHHSYKTEESRDKWAERYRARGDRVETEGVMIRG